MASAATIENVEAASACPRKKLAPDLIMSAFTRVIDALRGEGADLPCCIRVP